jgi:hypothetical protein
MKRSYEERTHPALRVLKFIGYIILGAIAAAAFAFVFGYLIMLLWNWLMPTLFGLTTITFWQAVGIAFLARLIFGGGKHGGDSNCKSNFRKSSPKSEFMNHFNKEYWKEREKCGDFKSKDWKHLDDYWWDEGEKSYKEYVERKNEQEQK